MTDQLAIRVTDWGPGDGRVQGVSLARAESGLPGGRGRLRVPLEFSGVCFRGLDVADPDLALQTLTGGWHYADACICWVRWRQTGCRSRREGGEIADHLERFGDRPAALGQARSAHRLLSADAPAGGLCQGAVALAQRLSD